MALLDGQFSYNGLTFGAGTAYGVTAAEDLEGFVARTNDRPVPRGHGSVPGKDYVAARQPLLKVLVTGTPTTSIEAATRTLYNTFNVSVDVELPLNFKRLGQAERLVYCRPVQLLRKLDPQTEFLAETPIAMVASDPRIYSADQHSVVIPLYSPSGGGFDLPHDLPLDFSVGASLTATANNAGNADSFPLWRFFGPASGTCTQVLVNNLTTGESLTITTSIGSGQVLSADGTAHVTGNGNQVIGLDGSSRYGSWAQTRQLGVLRLQPGDNVLRFQILGTATAMQATATWRDTSLS